MVPDGAGGDFKTVAPPCFILIALMVEWIRIFQSLEPPIGMENGL